MYDPNGMNECIAYTDTNRTRLENTCIVFVYKSQQLLYLSCGSIFIQVTLLKMIQTGLKYINLK